MTMRVEFEPGTIGMGFQGNIVSEIDDSSQAARKNVIAGMIIKEVNGESVPCDTESIIAAIGKTSAINQNTVILFGEAPPTYAESCDHPTSSNIEIVVVKKEGQDKAELLSSNLIQPQQQNDSELSTKCRSRIMSERPHLKCWVWVIAIIICFFVLQGQVSNIADATSACMSEPFCEGFMTVAPVESSADPADKSTPVNATVTDPCELDPESDACLCQECLGRATGNAGTTAVWFLAFFCTCCCCGRATIQRLRAWYRRQNAGPSNVVLSQQ